VSERTRTIDTLSVGLLAGFRVERAGVAVPDVAWHRRGAKRLMKLLAIHPTHAVHREQVLETLWSNADIDSARNHLGKALHAARRAVEPDRVPRQDSAYLRVRDDMLTLDPNHVVVDADSFELLARRALRRPTVSSYERALGAYTGVLLPEDLYEDWTLARRYYLADLNLQLLLDLAETLERRGAHREAVVRLRTALQDDPAREDVHRQLMRLYGAMGARSLALRQFEVCRAVLRRELNMAPDRETTALYQDLLANRTPQPNARTVPTESLTGLEAVLSLGGPHTTPFVGHEAALQQLGERLARSDAGSGGLVVISGEAGVGKTRLAATFALEAQRRGSCVLDGGHASDLPYGQFAVALEGYVTGRPKAERLELARRYPTLSYIVPSARTATPVLPKTDDPDDAPVYLGTEIARLLSDIAEVQTVVVVIGDLDEAHSSTLRLLQYLANLAQQRHWLMIATLHDEALIPGNGLSSLLTSMTHEDLCVHIELARLRRQECDALVGALLRGRAAESALLDRIFAVTLGNPLFVEELVREICEEPSTTALDRRRLAIDSFRMPTAVRARIERAVAPLGPAVRRVLELAAVADGEFTLDRLRDAAAALQPPLPDVELFDALDHALSTRILMERRGAYVIPHPLVRKVLLEALPQHRLRQIFTAVRGAPAESLALEETRQPTLTPVP
jgi:DNA-binding SARP family transcriptional activator